MSSTGASEDPATLLQSLSGSWLGLKVGLTSAAASELAPRLAVCLLLHFEADFSTADLLLACHGCNPHSRGACLHHRVVARSAFAEPFADRAGVPGAVTVEEVRRR